MARPWYSFYPADYGRDTGHLTLVEHGAYRVLMDHYYAHEAPLPANVARLFRLCRAKSEDEKKAVRFVLKEFFAKEADGYRHKRIEAEIAKAGEISAKASAAARIGAAKRQRIASAGPANARPSQLPSPSPPQSKESFEEFWSAYPRKEARGAAAKAWDRAVEMTAPETLIAAAKAYAVKREGQDAKFTRLPATWLAQECWLDDAPAIVDPQAAAAAWDGQAAGLVAEIGAAAFNAYFARCEFSPGPPAVIRVGKPHLRALIGKRFSGALKRAFGEFSLEA